MTDINPQNQTGSHPEQMIQLSKLWVRAVPAVESFVRTAVRDLNDCDDIIQGTAEYLAEHFHEFDQNGSFTGWAITVARYRVMALFRDRSRERLVLSSEGVEVMAEAAVQVAEQLPERSVALNECLQRLQPQQRRLMELCYLEGMKPAKIAERLGKSANSISVTLFRLRKALAQCIESRLGKSNEGGAK